MNTLSDAAVALLVFLAIAGVTAFFYFAARARETRAKDIREAERKIRAEISRRDRFGQRLKSYADQGDPVAKSLLDDWQELWKNI